MTRREKDLRKLKKFIESQGIKVVYQEIIEGDKDFLGCVSVEDKIIEIATGRKHKWPTITKLLALLHEYGHYLDYIYRDWTDEEDDAIDRFYSVEGHKSPECVKRLIWNLEERAHKYVMPLAEGLDIEIPDFLFKFDLEKTRKKLRLDFKQVRITNKEWCETKRKIRKKLRGRNVKEGFKRVPY